MNTLIRIGMALALLLAITWQLGCEPTGVSNYSPITPTVPRPPSPSYFKANAGPDQVISIPTNFVMLDASSSEDTGRVVSSYVWEKLLPGGINLVMGKGMKVQVGGLDEGVYAFRVVASDKQGTVSADTMQVTVVDNFAVGAVPVLETECDTVYRFQGEGAHVLSISSYVDSADIRYYFFKGFSFKQVSGPTQATISPQQYPYVNVVTIQNVTQGNYAFQVDVERKGARASDTIVLSLLPDTARGKEYMYEATWKQVPDTLAQGMFIYAEVPNVSGLLPDKTDRMMIISFSDDGSTWTDVRNNDFFATIYWGTDLCHQTITIYRVVNGTASPVNKKVRVRIKVVT